jgi:two-component system, NarL family, response regulator NreC
MMLAIRDQLTQREQEVLCLLATGYTDRKIAELLCISPRTVNRHMCNIFGKLEVPCRAAAAVHAVRKGLI